MIGRAHAGWVGAVLAAAVVAAGCEEEPGFTEPTKERQVVVDLEDQVVDGQRRLEYRVMIPAGVTHPSLEGLWTFRDPEKALNVYIVKAGQYNSTVAPDSLPNHFGIPPERNTVHVHPTPGEWVILFHNPATFGPTTRSEVSGAVELSFWR